MSPGYVRRHPRIIGAVVQVSDWDLSLIAAVDLLIPQPGPLRWAKAAGGGIWREWPVGTLTCPPRYQEPSGQDLARPATCWPAPRCGSPFPAAASRVRQPGRGMPGISWSTLLSAPSASWPANSAGSSAR
jgi:hypothetical protein